MDFKWLFFSNTEAWPFSLDSPTELCLDWEEEKEGEKGSEGREISGPSNLPAADLQG